MIKVQKVKTELYRMEKWEQGVKQFGNSEFFLKIYKFRGKYSANYAIKRLGIH